MEIPEVNPPIDGLISQELLDYMRSKDFRRDLDDFFRQNEAEFTRQLKEEPLFSKLGVFKPKETLQPIPYSQPPEEKP